MSDLLNYVKKHSPSIDRQDEIRQAILKWRKENPIEAPKNNDDDSILEAGWQGFKANAGSALQTISDAIIDSGKPKDVTMEDWKADLVKNSPFGWNPVVAASELGAEIAKENARKYTPMSDNSIAYGIGGVAPYAIGLGVTGAAAARTGNYKALGDIARTAAGQAVTKASGLPVFGATIARHSPAITKAAGVVAPAATVGAMQTVPEAMVERQSTMDEYVADAKKNNTYVKGQTEAEAREIANRVAADNVGLLTGTNTLEQALLARTPVGKLGRIAKQVGVGAGLNAAEEGAQTIFPLTEAGKSWSWNDPQILESMVVGGLFGGAAQGVGAATGAYLDDKTASTEPIAKEKPATVKANTTSGNEDIDRIILEKSKQYGIDPDLVHAVIWKESRYNPKAVSPVGAVGLMQLMEGTAGDLGVTNREDIEQNIDGGIRYLKQMYEKNGGDWNAQDRETWEKALASYNGGYGNRNLTQTRLYAHDVWNKYNEFRGENADADITATDADTDDVSTIDTEDVERNAIEYAKHKIDKSDEDYTFLNDAIRRNDKQAVMDKYSAQDIQDWADYQVLNDQKLNEKYMKNRDANIKKILQNGEIKITNRQMLPFYRQNDTFRGGTINKVEGGYLYTPPKDFMNRAEVGRIAEENGITEMPVKESPQAQRDEMWGTKNDTLEQQLAKAHKRDEQKQLDEWAKEYAEEEELAGYEKEYARQDLATVLNNISAKKKGEQELLDQWAKEYEAEEARVNQWVADEEAREQAEAQEKQALTQRMADTLNNLIATGREDTARRLLQVLNSPQVTDNAIANDEELARQMAEGRARADQERRKEKYRAYQAEKEAKAREGLNQRLTNAIAGILENERNDLAGQMAEGRENAVQERQAREGLSQRLANAVAGILENEKTTLANQMAEGREQAEKQRKQEAEANAPAEEVTAEPKQEKTGEKTEEAVPKTETVEETPKESVEESSEAEPQEDVSETENTTEEAETEPQETVPEKENIAEEKESESEEKKDSLSSAKPKKGRWWRKEYPDKKSKAEFILEKSEVTEESATILDAVSEDEEYLSRLIEEERAALADLKKQFGEDWLSGMREVRDETAKQYKALIDKYAKMMLERVLTNKNDAWIKEYRDWYFRLLNEGKTKQERLGTMLEGLRKEATHQLRNRPIDAKLGKPLIGEESCTKFAELEAVLDGYAYIQIEADKYHQLQSKGKTSVNIAETDIQGETENAKTQQRTSGRSEKKGERNNRVRDLKSKTPQREVKYTFVIDGEGKNPTELRNVLPKQGMVDRSFQTYTDGRIEVQYYNNMQKKAYDSVTALGFKPKDEKSKFDKATAEQFPLVDTHNERLEEFYNNVRDWCKKQGTGTLAKIVGKSKAQWFAAEGDTNHSPTGFLDFCNQAVLKGYKLPQKWVKLYKDTRKGREELYEAFEDIGKTTPQEAEIGENAKFQITDNSEVKRTFDEIKAEVEKAFPNAKSVKYDGNDILVTLPNDTKVRVSIKDKIIVNEKAAKRAREAHGVEDDGDISIQGYWQKVSDSDIDGVIAISKDSTEGTAYHESLHMAMDLALTPKEKKALNNHYAKEAKASGKAVEESIADGYAKWRKNRENAKFKGIFKKLHDFWHRLKAVFTGIENAHNVMRKIESGEVWERKADKAIRDKIKGDSTFGKIANENLIRDEAEFANSVDAMQKGTLDQTKLVKVMHTPLVLQLIGARDLPIKIKYSDLYKIALDKHFDSKSVENVKKLPRKMADPIAIFRSATREDSYVLMLELESDTGATYVASVAIDKIENDGGFEINLLTSAYGRGEKKPNDKWFANQVENGNLLYVNTKKARAWGLSKGVQFPEKKLHNGAFLASSIKTESDLVKLRKQHPTKYSVASRVKNKFGKTKNLTHELRLKNAITNLTGLKVAWGHTDKDIIYDEKQGVIRTRTAQDWGRVIPQVAEVVAKRLGMGIKTVDGKKIVDPAMKDYITEYIFTGALTKANTKEAKEFERIMQKNPKESEDILALKCEFERYGALTLSEQAMENLETDVKQSRTLKQKAVWMMMKLVDKYYPVRLMSMKMYKKFKELGEEMPRYLNPNTIVKNVSGATAQASMLIHLPQKRFSANATENKKLIMESIEATKDMIRREFPSVEESLIQKFKPLELILQEAGMYGDDTEAKKFQTYMVARRMLELHDREGIEEFPEVYNTPEKCRQIIAELETPAYIQAAEDLYNLQTLSLAIQVDCGTLSQTYFDRVTNENKNYIPLRRLIDDEKMTRNADSTKKVEGSARVVWAPFDQAMDNIANGFVKAQKNKAMAQVGQAAKLLGQAKTIEVVENNQPNSRNVVSYLVNGERVYIEAYPELAMSLAHITESRAATGIVKMISMANRMPRELLTTNNPEFAFSAFFRDAMNFFLYEKGDPVDLFKGLKHTLLRDSVFQEYMTSGASQSVLTAADKDYFARNVTGSDKGSLSGFKNVIKALDKITSAPTEVMEQAVRVAAYEKTKNRVMKEELDNLEAKLRKSGMTEAQIRQAIQEYGMKDAIMTATVEARLTARDLMDFASRGEWGDALNSWSWFANAIIQGGYKSVRALNWKDPANKGKIQGRLLRLASVCILQAALSAMGEDDDEIKGLSDSDRYMYFHARVGDSVLRIPKGDDLGIRTLTFWIDMMSNKREATLRRAMLPLENAVPNPLMASVFGPIIEVLANYSFFYNSEIVPKRLQNPALPEREHDAFTSRLAKEIGEAFHWSPKKVDYMMNAYFGGLGRLGRGAIDWAVDDKAPKEMAVVRRFVVPKGKTSVFVNDAYEYISEQDALYKDWQERRKTDPRAKADEKFDKAKYTRLKTDKEKLKELTEKIRKNRENSRITEAQREANHIVFTKARNKLAESIMFR